MDWKSAARAAALAGAAFTATVAPATAAAAQLPAAIDYDLPAQDLGATLRAIARASGREILFESAAVRGRTAPAIRGRFSFDEAIRSALAGTNLELEYRAGAALVRERGSGRTEAVVPNSLTPAKASPTSDSQASITVTGTRIRGVGSASPVIVTTRRALEQAGVNDLAAFTRILPQNYTGGQNPGIAGDGEQGGQSNLNNSAALNLRGLGEDATLTLLNGHRLSYDGLDQGVDISAIPLDAIDRIEVVADGASALYGSDAVAGVANIILRRDYDGVQATARLGGSTDGGNFQQQYSLVGGRRSSSGGFMVALDASSATPIMADQRDYTKILDPSLTLTSRNRQHSGVLTAHHEIAGGLELEVDGTAMDRHSLSQSPFSPNADVHVNGLVSRSRVTSYALTPTLRAELGSWEASLSGTGANSRTFLDTNNYFNSVPRHAHLLYEDSLKGVEGTAEGPLFALPGGDARLGLGGGFRTIALHDRYLLLTGGQSVTVKDFTERRSAGFAYGELSLPLVRPELRLPLIERLTVTGALRYEHWNKIASVTTPKFGLLYQPGAGVSLRATWGKSFKIPTLIQVNQLEEGDLVPGFYFTPPPQPSGSTVLLLAGSAPNLKPEHATTWSATIEVKPRVLPGLDFTATWFHVDYRDRIAQPLTSVLSVLYNPLYSGFITYDPSAAQVNAVIAGLPGGLSNQTGAPFDPASVGAIINASTRNTERQRIHGLDLSADYRLDFGEDGKLLLTGAASYLESEEQLAANQPLLPLAGTVFNPPHWRGRAGIVWDGQRAGLSAFVNYLGPTTDNIFPTLKRVAAFVTLDLNASLRTDARSGPLRNVEIRLSALNVLDEKPHAIRNVFPEAVPYDSTNESPVGRFLGISIRKGW